MNDGMQLTPKSEARNTNSEVDTEQEEDVQGISGPSTLSSQQQRRRLDSSVIILETHISMIFFILLIKLNTVH